MKKILVLTVFAFVIVSIFSGCKGNETPSLAGNWNLEDGQDFFGTVEDYKLSKDGSGIADFDVPISWKTKNNRFSYTNEANKKTREYNYKISGTTLTITLDDGRSLTYKKYNDKPNEFGNWRSMLETDPVKGQKTILFKNFNADDYIEFFIRKDPDNIVLFMDLFTPIGSERDVIFQVDGKDTETKTWIISENGEALFYPEDPLPAIKSLLDGKKLTVTYTPENMPQTTAVFDITGLKEIAAKYKDDLLWF